jgi:hypothetical protein
MRFGAELSKDAKSAPEVAQFVAYSDSFEKASRKITTTGVRSTTSGGMTNLSATNCQSFQAN